MKKSIQSTVLLLMALIVPMTATAAYDQLADGVYLDGTTLYITSGVTSLGDLQVDPDEIYCYATIPPACVSNTFLGYDATIHVPAAGMVSYFTTLYWYNFNNILSDAIEPMSVAMNTTEAELEIGQQLSLIATVTPSDATPKTVYWSSTDSSVATINRGCTVTAVAAGECDIFARCIDKVAVCHVTVVPPRVTITLDKHEARLLPNHTLTLTATCSPIDVELAVTSSNPDVAIPRIVNGTIMVVGVAEGTAVITVNAADGCGNPDSCAVTVYTEHGDVNCDGYVSISDVTILIDFLLSDSLESFSAKNADTNRDGKVSISDVTALIDFLLSGAWPQEGVYTVNGVSFKMIEVEGGTFIMGASDGDTNAQNNERPTHQVTLSGFQIGETEVTQALWTAVMASNPSHFSGYYTENNPVEQVSWIDCQEFIAKLNQITGKHFRLPTEAEWEFAARGGNKSMGYKYSGSNIINEVAWYSSNATHEVATKAPNELGLYDMSGNVMEWCQDWYDSYSDGAQTNPCGPVSGIYRVARNSGWNSVEVYNRVSVRWWEDMTTTSHILGLRLALDEDNNSKFRLSETVLTVIKSNSETVDILNGSGSYTVMGDSECVTASVNGDMLMVAGESVGTTTVHVTDNNTGAAIVLTVIVASNEEVYTISGKSFKMVAVKGGTFTMGATEEQGNDAKDNEKPAHQVTLSSYWIGETEVTQELWLAVMGNNPSSHNNGGSYPVEQVSWNDCQLFITKLNAITGKNFRLPTEAEWEFAARGGVKSLFYKYSGSNDYDEVAWCFPNVSSSYNYRCPRQVKNKKANELGLYDMSGNVSEWCQDWYGPYDSLWQLNPNGPSEGTSRVFRGGDYWSNPERCRVSNRNALSPAESSGIGLRLCM